jgi:hypothetical protein
MGSLKKISVLCVLVVFEFALLAITSCGKVIETTLLSVFEIVFFFFRVCFVSHHQLRQGN